MPRKKTGWRTTEDGRRVRSLGAELEELEQTDPGLRRIIKQAELDGERRAMRDRINERRKAEGKPPLRIRGSRGGPNG
jgi:hypothetical protein